MMEQHKPKQGLEIGSNKEFIQIKFNFSLKERIRIAWAIIRKSKAQFILNGPKYEEINLS